LAYARGVRRVGCGPGNAEPLAHYRHLLDEDSLTARAMRDEEPPDTILEEDARAVVKALHRLANRPPFALGPIICPNGEEPTVHPHQMHRPIWWHQGTSP
jgi:hypothetical protein